MQDVFMEELKKWVVRYPGTARPGEVWNAFIFGHSSNYPWVASEYNDVFALIDTLITWDEIVVYYDQAKYTYRITDRATVEPGDTQALSARDPSKKELSIMTCWPVGTTLERYIIFAELIE
jgi:LPXTG-site transpeptidase (sortase) family protein